MPLHELAQALAWPFKCIFASQCQRPDTLGLPTFLAMSTQCAVIYGSGFLFPSGPVAVNPPFSEMQVGSLTSEHGSIRASGNLSRDLKAQEQGLWIAHDDLVLGHRDLQSGSSVAHHWMCDDD